MLNKNSKYIFDALHESNFNCWFVGGCVRDHLNGSNPNDIDLATDATPEQYQQILSQGKKTNRIFTTGIEHGTCTILVNTDQFELTSLRVDTEHDGRHAQVNYTTDINLDLSRRDLTYNALAMTYAGEIIDPFNGSQDLENRITKFAGNSAQRIQEDYLRILRFFRFHARFSGNSALDNEAYAAILAHKNGLNNISKERIWSEIKKIISGPHAHFIICQMEKMEILKTIGMSAIDTDMLNDAINHGVKDSASILGACIDLNDLNYFFDNMRLSKKEMELIKFVATHKKSGSVEYLKNLLVDGHNPEWINDLVSLSDLAENPLLDWKIPTFPINGNDMKEIGITDGVTIGKTIRHLISLWKASEYTETRNELLEKAKCFNR